MSNSIPLPIRLFSRHSSWSAKRITEKTPPKQIISQTTPSRPIPIPHKVGKLRDWTTRTKQDPLENQINEPKRILPYGIETLPLPETQESLQTDSLEKWSKKFRLQKEHLLASINLPEEGKIDDEDGDFTKTPSSRQHLLRGKSRSDQSPLYTNLLGQAKLQTREVLELRRTTKVTEGGKVYSFRACVALGNRRGEGGIGFGKSLLPGKAIEKACVDAMQHWNRFRLHEQRTIMEPMKCDFGVTKIAIRPTRADYGLRVHHVIAMMSKCFGICDLSGNVIGSRNRLRIAKGFFDMLVHQKSVPSKVPSSSPSSKTTRKLLSDIPYNKSLQKS